MCFQLSGDESRRLCAGGAKVPEKSNAEATNLGVATYGSVVFQLKDAHLEANGICDFVFRALKVISKTMTFTICLSCLSTVPILMFIFGECEATQRIVLSLASGRRGGETASLD